MSENTVVLHCVGGKTPFDEFHIRRLDEAAVVECWYRYTYGEYEGYGWAVFRFSDGEFDAKDLSHCSCYGPLETGVNGPDYKRGKTFPTIEALRAAHSADALAEMADVLAAVGAA